MQSLIDAPPIAPRRRTAPTGAKRWRKRIAWLLILALGGTAAAWYRIPLTEKFHALAGSSKGASAIANIQMFSVKRGQLRITMVEEGKLRAVKNNFIIMNVQGKITWLADAGAKVKKGDLLVTIDKKPFEDQRVSRVNDLEAAKAALAIAEQSVPISRSNGLAAVAAAKTKRDEAMLALKTYTTIEVPKKLSDFETQINDGRSKLADAQKKKTDAQAQLDEKMLDDDDEKKSLEQNVELQKQTVASLQRVGQNLQDQRKLFRAYDYPQSMKSKQQAVVNAELEVSKAEVAAKSELMQKEADVRKNQILINRLEKQIAELDDMISKCSARAPVDGLVFYGSPEMNRYYSDVSERIRVGIDWYSNGAIMTIPDLSAFQVDVPIAEVYRGRISIGMPATITIEAVPGLVIDGRLSTLASAARNKIPWDTSSPQVFDGTLDLAGADDRMVAGMTVKVEIMTAELNDVLYAPVEAVYNEEGKTAVFLWLEGPNGSGGHVEKHPVLTGQSNDHFVEIKKGLHEGDRLLLSRPQSFSTPVNYREQVEEMFPPAPATRPAPIFRTPPPDSQPATLSAAAGTRPAATSPAAAGTAAADTLDTPASSMPAADTVK
jgi:multidrug resistance efflux pump